MMKKPASCLVQLIVQVFLVSNAMLMVMMPPYHSISNETLYLYKKYIEK